MPAEIKTTALTQFPIDEIMTSTGKMFAVMKENNAASANDKEKGHAVAKGIQQVQCGVEETTKIVLNKSLPPPPPQEKNELEIATKQADELETAANTFDKSKKFISKFEAPTNTLDNPSEIKKPWYRFFSCCFGSCTCCQPANDQNPSAPLLQRNRLS
jgi:hypothetical protein